VHTYMNSTDLALLRGFRLDVRV